MICSCMEEMEKKLKASGIENPMFRDTDIDPETGEASLIIPMVVSVAHEDMPYVHTRQIIGIRGEYCPFCGRCLTEDNTAECEK